MGTTFTTNHTSSPPAHSSSLPSRMPPSAPLDIMPSVLPTTQMTAPRPLPQALGATYSTMQHQPFLISMTSSASSTPTTTPPLIRPTLPQPSHRHTNKPTLTLLLNTHMSHTPQPSSPRIPSNFLKEPRTGLFTIRASTCQPHHFH